VDINLITIKTEYRQNHLHSIIIIADKYNNQRSDQNIHHVTPNCSTTCWEHHLGVSCTEQSGKLPADDISGKWVPKWVREIAQVPFGTDTIILHITRAVRTTAVYFIVGKHHKAKLADPQRPGTWGLVTKFWVIKVTYPQVTDHNIPFV
jgi:hypothetical protein